MWVAVALVFGLVVRLALCGVDDRIPQVEKVDIVEFSGGDFLVYWGEELVCCGGYVDVSVEVFLNCGVIVAVLFWAKPASDFGDFINLLRWSYVLRENGVDLLLLVLLFLATSCFSATTPHTSDCAILSDLFVCRNRYLNGFGCCRMARQCGCL